MTTVPPPSTPPPPTTAAPPAAPVVQILAPPPAVVALPPGTVLEAVVKPTPPSAGTPADPKQQTVTLRTPQGDVTIKLPVQLPDNAKVALEILRASQANQPAPQINVRILTVENQPAAQVLAQLARQTAADPRAAAQQPPTQLLQIPVNDPQNPLLRTATLPPGAGWMPSGPVQLPSLGTVSAFVVLGNPMSNTPQTLPPALNALQSTLANIPTSPSVATAPVAGSLGAVGASPATSPHISLMTGGEVSLRITTVTLPNAVSITAPALTPATPPPLVTPPANAASPAQLPAPQIGPIVTNAQRNDHKVIEELRTQRPVGNVGNDRNT